MFSLAIPFKSTCLFVKNIGLDFFYLQIPTRLILAPIGDFTLCAKDFVQASKLSISLLNMGGVPMDATMRVN